MKDIWTADCETDPFKRGRIPEPFIWGLYNGDEYYEFEKTNDFVDFCANLKNSIIYAHNGGKFDWHFIKHKIPEYSELLIINGRLSKFKIGEAEFRDSYNILPMPLSAWKKDDFDYTILEKEVRYLKENYKKTKKYLKNDCVYLFEIIKEYHDRYGMSLTLAGSAMKEWRKISKQKSPKTTKSFYDSLKKYYYGGRVECFKKGIIEKEFKVVDINSAYSFAMDKNLHPYGNIFIRSEKLPDSKEKTSRAFITLKCVSEGALPFRDKSGLNFPNDGVERIYDITGWEFLVATKNKKLKNIEIIEVIEFAESISFDSYINHFFELKTKAKKENDYAGYIFAKFFLNALYGKFGSNPGNYKEYMTIPYNFVEAANEDGYDYCADFGENSLCSRPLPEEKENYYNVAVAASITGYVRAYLYDSMLKCEDVLYCDTDAIACERTGDLKINPTDIGAWDIEAECDYGAIAGKKVYAFKTKDGKWKTAKKGTRLNHKDIIKIAKGETVTYNYEAPTFSLKRETDFISRNIKMN